MTDWTSLFRSLTDDNVDFVDNVKNRRLAHVHCQQNQHCQLSKEEKAEAATPPLWASLAALERRRPDHIRPPSARWSSPLPVRPPRFETPGRLSLPVCTGWCSGCGVPSTWRASPAPNASGQRWQCVRCAAQERHHKHREGDFRYAP
jgi:hypothetical protein